VWTAAIEEELNLRQVLDHVPPFEKLHHVRLMKAAIVFKTGANC
jgi:hypothetical protein